MDEKLQAAIDSVVSLLSEGKVREARNALDPLEAYLNAQDIVDKEITQSLETEIAGLFFNKFLTRTRKMREQ